MISEPLDRWGAHVEQIIQTFEPASEAEAMSAVEAKADISRLPPNVGFRG
jgi:hypothetical protein